MPDFDIRFSDNMSDKEIEESKLMMNELDPLYTRFVKEIFFFKDTGEMNQEDNEVCLKAYNGTGCGGFNDDGDITIKWVGTRTISVLCHELLHDYINSESNKATKVDGFWVYEDPKHTVIYDLGKKGVCYK